MYADTSPAMSAGISAVLMRNRYVAKQGLVHDRTGPILSNESGFLMLAVLVLS